MDEPLARQISVELSSMIAAFNRLSELTLSIADENERRDYRKSLGELMARCDHGLIRPITKAHPHLDPIKE
ncbi:MAG: hypothetical protein R3C31_06885 [Hyphomonadaceae bacterium]